MRKTFRNPDKADSGSANTRIEWPTVQGCRRHEGGNADLLSFKENWTAAVATTYAFSFGGG